MFYRVFETKLGCAALVSGGKGIMAFYLPAKRSDIMKSVKKDFPGAVLRSDTEIRKAEALLKRYFAGQKVSFRRVRTDIARLKSFARAVLKKTATISYGCVKSYTWAGSGKARPAGGALGSNPVPVIIPCHRVIENSGKFGGFSSGLAWKRRLLAIENIIINTK